MAGEGEYSMEAVQVSLGMVGSRRSWIVGPHGSLGPVETEGVGNVGFVDVEVGARA